MKTQNNNQKTVKGQVSKFTLRAGAVLLGAVLLSASVDAQDLWNQLSNSVSYGKMALTMDEQSSETQNADAAIEIIHSELASLLNTTNESSAKTYTEDALEVESWMTDEAFFKEAEQYTAESAEFEIAKYAERLIRAEKEEALSVETWMTDKSFFIEEEQYTADGADFEIAKYAKRMMDSEETEKALPVEGWMTDESFFREAEQYTADGTDFEIAKYAIRMMDSEENE